MNHVLAPPAVWVYVCWSDLEWAEGVVELVVGGGGDGFFLRSWVRCWTGDRSSKMTAVCCAFWVCSSVTTFVIPDIWVPSAKTALMMTLLVKNSLSDVSDPSSVLGFQGRSVVVSASTISSLTSVSAIGISPEIAGVVSKLKLGTSVFSQSV